MRAVIALRYDLERFIQSALLREIQVMPGNPSEFRKQRWMTEKATAARVHRTEYWTGKRSKETDREILCVLSKASDENSLAQ